MNFFGRFTSAPSLAAGFLALLCLLASPVTIAWMWDTDSNGIDDRIERVDIEGLSQAYEYGSAVLGRLQFAVRTDANGALRYGVYVGYDSRPTAADLQAIRDSGVDLTVFHPYRYIDYVRMELTFAEIQTVAALPGVSRIESIPMYYPVNNVATVTSGAKSVNREVFPTVRDQLGLTGEGVVVSILDTGVNDNPFETSGYPGHESLMGRFVAGGEFFLGQPELNTGVDESMNPIDNGEEASSNHGTHVAGTALGTGGNTELFGGMAPNARFVDQKVLSDAGAGFGSADGIEWAIANKDRYDIRVLNLSLGGTQDSDGTDANSRAIDAAFQEGIVSAIAMGNDGNTEYVPSPASASLGISVGSFDDMNTIGHDDDLISDFSNEGPRNGGTGPDVNRMKPVVSAPGSSIISSDGSVGSDGTAYKSLSGTSMATPGVAGIIALMIEACPEITAPQIVDVLKHTSVHIDSWGKTPSSSNPFPNEDPNWHPSGGWGRADAYAAAKDALRICGDPASQTQVIQIGAAPDSSGLESITVNWVSQRETALSGYHIYRAPDDGGEPGEFTRLTTDLVPGTGSESIEGIANRNHYAYIDDDVEFGQIYWYQIEHTSEAGVFQEAPYPVILGEPAPVAVLRYTITHDSIDNDLQVTLGTGLRLDKPDFTVSGRPEGEAESVTSVGFDATNGSNQHVFEITLTSLDKVGDLLPPSISQPWFLRVVEGGFINRRGTVDAFEIDVYDASGETVVQTFQTGDPVPQNTVEGQTVELWIPGNPTSTGPGEAPVVAEMEPSSAQQGAQDIAVTIFGGHFKDDVAVSMSGAGLTLSDVQVQSPTEITAVLSVADDAEAGARSVTVTNNLDGGTDTGDDLFTVILVGGETGGETGGATGGDTGGETGGDLKYKTD